MSTQNALHYYLNKKSFQSRQRIRKSCVHQRLGISSMLPQPTSYNSPNYTVKKSYIKISNVSLKEVQNLHTNLVGLQSSYSCTSARFLRVGGLLCAGPGL